MTTSKKRQRSKLPPRLDRWYPSAEGKPIPWDQYPSVKVVQAVRRYLWLDVDSRGHKVPCTREDGRYLLAYLQYAIAAPGWQCDPADLAELRTRAYFLADSLQVGDWLQDCLTCGVDILGGF